MPMQSLQHHPVIQRCRSKVGVFSNNQSFVKQDRLGMWDTCSRRLALWQPGTEVVRWMLGEKDA